jgi:hypothetical protein
MLGIAMREPARKQVGLRGARRHARRRPNALNVEDHAGQSRRNIPARQTPPSAKCPVPRSPSSRARRPIPRPAPCRSRPARLPPAQSRKSPCHPARRGTSSCSRSAFSTTDDDGVIGYHVTTVTPANMQPIAAAALPSMMILPSVACIALQHKRVLLGQRARRIVEARLAPRPVQLRRLLLLGELLAHRLLHRTPCPSKQLRATPT